MPHTLFGQIEDARSGSDTRQRALGGCGVNPDRCPASAAFCCVGTTDQTATEQGHEVGSSNTVLKVDRDSDRR